MPLKRIPKKEDVMTWKQVDELIQRLVRFKLYKWRIGK